MLDDLQVYLVGGAVRDHLLGIDASDRDFVVVGANSEQMLALGFSQVGKDFPVFLHPITHEEYALARRERKSGRGHGGFCFDSDGVSLADDLLRRDLTINAMAMDKNGNIIDPYGGQNDLKNKTLRHVSCAFSEDPLRVFRVARFAARFDFKIAPTTQIIMQNMADTLKELPCERVWQETQKALAEPYAWRYFEVLNDARALDFWFGELLALDGVSQPAVHHPEGCALTHTLLALKIACQMGASSHVKFAVLCHDLGKALTPKDEWPRHIAHERRGLAPTHALCKRLKVPLDYQKLALKTCEYHTHCHLLPNLRPATIDKLFSALDAMRNPQLVQDFATACLCDARGRGGFENTPYPNADLLMALSDVYRQKVEIPPNLTGQKIREHISKIKRARIKAFLNKAIIGLNQQKI